MTQCCKYSEISKCTLNSKLDTVMQYNCVRHEIFIYLGECASSENG